MTGFLTLVDVATREQASAAPAVLDPIVIGLTGRAGAGKDTAAARLCSIHGFVSYAFAQPIRDMVEQLLIGCAVDYAHVHERDMKERVIPQLGVSARHLMQSLGDWGRGLRDDFWLQLANLHLGLPDAPVHDRIVITDVRYPNEAEWVAALGGHLIRVERRAPGVRPHSSEQHVESLPFATWLDNSLGLDHLHAQVDALVGPFRLVPASNEDRTP